MKRTIRRILFVFIVFIFSILLTNTVSANNISKVNMDIYIDSNGNAKVTEIWNTNLTQGTEGYRAYSNLGNSYITNFKVSDDTGKTYNTLSSWNTNASFLQKAYKCGIHYIANGLELCWGISDYGDRTYTLNYNINNLVTQYADNQGIYFNFLNLNQFVGSAKITIHSDTPFSIENSKIWAFGNQGTINFKDGSIVLDSGGNLSSTQYMVGLIKFEKNIFNTSSKSTQTFNDIYESAFSDVSDNLENKKNKNNVISLIIHFAMLFLFSVFTMCFPLFFIVFFTRARNRRNATFYYGPNGKNLPDDKQIEYYRDIPCNNNLERAYWVCYTYNIVPEKELKQGIIGAILLKWIKDGYIKVTKTKQGFFNLKDNDYAIDFNQMTYEEDNEIEKYLFKMIIAAAGENKILEAKEFKKFSKENYSEINNWFSNILEKEQKRLEYERLITTNVVERKGIFTGGRITTKIVSEKLREEAIHLKGLKKFLLDYSMMPEKEYFEVHIWEEYLIFAQLLGIADKVQEQFNKLYPNLNQETLLDPQIATIAARSMAIICYESVRKGNLKSSIRNNYSGSDVSSGGGGSSYSSGGGSSGGSSGGGFR